MKGSHSRGQMGAGFESFSFSLLFSPFHKHGMGAKSMMCGMATPYPWVSGDKRGEGTNQRKRIANQVTKELTMSQQTSEKQRLDAVSLW